MNQRAHIRRQVDMPGRISNDAFSDRPCQIRDFCLGGMLLELPGNEVTLLASLRQGDRITLSLDVQGLRGTRAVSLPARLARVDGSQLGIAFNSPDPSSLLAVQNHVRSLLDQDAAPGRSKQSRLTAEQRAGAAADIVELTRRFCTSRMESFFPAAKQALTHKIDSPSVSDAGIPWMAAAKILAESEPGLVRNFITGAVTPIELLAHGVAVSAAPNPSDTLTSSSDSSRLSLVDKDVFEDWLTLKVMASKAEGRFNEELLHLQLRFDELFSISLSARKNPLHPSVFCNAFGQALGLLPLKHKTDRPILAAFEEQFISHLNDFYIEANILLARHGVLTDLDVGRYISENYGHVFHENDRPWSSLVKPSDSDAAARIAPSRQDKAQESSDDILDHELALREAPPVLTEQGDSDETETETETSIVAEHTRSSAAPAKTQSHKRSQSSTLAARQFALQQHIAKHAYDTVKSLLSNQSLQAARHRSYEKAGSTTATPIADATLQATLNQMQRQSTDTSEVALPERLLQALQGEEGESGHLDHDSQAAVEVVHNLFAGIVSNPALSGRVRDAIRRLEVPFLRLLLSDESVLEQEAHPARQMLNRIAHLGVRGSANLQVHEEEIEQEVGSILSGFDQDASIFEGALAKLDKLAERQRSLYLRNMKRVTENCDGRYKVVLAKREVNQALERRIGGKHVPRAVLSLIDAGWRQLLVQTLLRGGRDSREWHEYLGVIDRMLGAVQKVPAQSELTAMLVSIKAGLGQVDHTQMHNARLISELRDLLSKKARDQHPPDIVDVPPGLVDEQSHQAAEEFGEIEQRWIRRAKRVEQGEWFSYFDSGQDQIVRLAWTDTEKNVFVFVNHQGMKVTEHEVAEFASRLASGQMQRIDNLDAPAVDRGLEHMVQRVYDQMAHQATHDELCGLVNRRECERRLRQQFAASQEPGSLLQIDLDQFKVVNNLAGTEGGDELLIAFTALLKEQFSGSLIARLGADEFAVWLEGQNADASRRIAEQFCRRVSSEKFVCAGKPFSITVSCGLAHRQGPADTASELLRSADSACHAAKEAGRNRLQEYRADDKELVKRDDIMAWVSRLNDAIEGNRLMLRCQRIESTVANGHLPAYEILISLAGEGGEEVAPAEFIHAAERYNRMHAVDRWVLSNVFRWMFDNPEALSRVDHLSINLSGHSLNDTTLLEFLFELFRRYPVPREKLCFEVTETAAISNLDEATDFIRELQDLGCRFSLDDFGSGLASYGHLKSLPVDYIKIDGSFIRGVASDSADLAMVRSINEMGHLMGKRTIAEYVENDQIRALMAEVGIDYVQGFGVEKPKPLDALKVA